MKIREALSKVDIDLCTPVILDLRPHLTNSDLWALYQNQMKENYRILYILDDQEAVSFIGYRIQNMFHSGRTLYIDDLSTLPGHRGKGYAGQLLEVVFTIAEKNKCQTVSLDSGHFRHAAHRLYLNKGFIISSHHFHKTMD
ncbi:MAG TPA: GNAT family N-acetyltransferase [Saprospiraceae bacterium]|nr:GNAT family N-acetyltransferase [Saprospiraceae bacterium]